MQFTTSKSIILALVVICASTTSTFSQQYKEGAEVVALRDAELKAGSKRLGNVRKGQKLTIEQVQDKWLWVRSGQTKGWIDQRSVISSDLMAWYKRLGDMGSSVGAGKATERGVDGNGEGRAKILGVTLRVLGLKAHSKPRILCTAGGGLVISGWGNVISGVVHRPDGTATVWPKDGVNIEYGNVHIVLERTSARSRTLSINGRSCGAVQQGSHILIDESRNVFVDGHRRTLQR